MGQYRAEACSRRVLIQPEGQAEVREGSDRASGEECFEVVKSVLAVGAPMEDRILPGQCMERACDGYKIFNIAPVVLGPDPGRSGLQWQFWEVGPPEWPRGVPDQAGGPPLLPGAPDN